MRAMTKSELALAAGVSAKTLQRWLARHREELALLGVRPNDRLLPPVAVKYVCEQYGIDVEPARDTRGHIAPYQAGRDTDGQRARRMS